MRAEYECDCGHKWGAEIRGGVLPLLHDKVHSTECPVCLSIYFKWTNYKEFTK